MSTKPRKPASPPKTVIPICTISENGRTEIANYGDRIVVRSRSSFQKPFDRPTPPQPRPAKPAPGDRLPLLPRQPVPAPPRQPTPREQLRQQLGLDSIGKPKK